MFHKDKIDKYCILAFIPTFLVMLMIFHFSSQSALDSSQLSGGIIENVVGYVEEGLHLEMNTTKRNIWMESGETLLRKAAHMSEYFLLAIATSFGFCVNVTRREKCFRFSIILCLLYATSDEFHQLFVPGRSGQFGDVIIDGFGALVGCLLFLWMEQRMFRKLN